LEDSDLEEIALDMEVRYRYTVAERPLFSAVVRVAKMNKIEPIKDYLNGLEWDNETRIRDVFSQVFNCQVPKGAEDLIQVISHKWFISCVARILEPGCKMDTCLVLVGSKGLGKSTALKILASERYFSDSLINISHKDSYELIHQSGTWIWELAEMHALQGKTADNSKQFLSSAKDRYRPSYGKNPVERARRTVFTASTNNFQFLSDGPERRFWPITIQDKIDSDYLIDNRDQLWAEAVHYYQCGEKWWLPEKLEPTLELYQTSFIIDDPWTIPVVEYLRQSLGQGRTTTEIMEHLEIPKASQHTGYARRVAQICRDNGYHRGFDSKNKTVLYGKEGNKMITLHNGDCLAAMREMRDNEFDLAIVDPPYGINYAKNKSVGGVKKNRYTSYDPKDWDSHIPSQDYFDELKRVSKKYLIFGANYFSHQIPQSGNWIVWDKRQGDNNFSMHELIFASFKITPKIVSIRSHRNTVSNSPDKVICRIHPTQKPVALYTWLLQKYANEGDKILDTHLGSGSIAIACHNLGFDLTGYELDKDYFQAAKKRLEAHQETITIVLTL
jgi:site-specific DNA-methyltransferase (adenine-specific)